MKTPNPILIKTLVFTILCSPAFAQHSTNFPMPNPDMTIEIDRFIARVPKEYTWKLTNMTGSSSQYRLYGKVMTLQSGGTDTFKSKVGVLRTNPNQKAKVYNKPIIEFDRYAGDNRVTVRRQTVEVTRSPYHYMLWHDGNTVKFSPYSPNVSTSVDSRYQISVSNHLPEPIKVAVQYLDDKTGKTVVEGWWAVAPGTTRRTNLWTKYQDYQIYWVSKSGRENPTGANRLPIINQAFRYDRPAGSNPPRRASGGATLERECFTKPELRSMNAKLNKQCSTFANHPLPNTLKR